METKRITINKAIGRLRSFLRWRKPEINDDLWEAVQMGLDALERCKYIRTHPSEPRVSKLKGEVD